VAAVCACRLAAPSAVRRRPAVGQRAARPLARPRAGLREEDGPLLAVAIASVGIARLAQQAITALGGFDLRPIPGGRFAPLGQVPGNAHVLWQSIVLLFGVNSPGVPGRAITRSQHVPLLLMMDLHVIGLVLAGAGLAAGIAAGSSAGLARPGERTGPAGRPEPVHRAKMQPKAKAAARRGPGHPDPRRRHRRHHGGRRVRLGAAVALQRTRGRGPAATGGGAGWTHAAALAARLAPARPNRLTPARVATVALVAWLASAWPRWATRPRGRPGSCPCRRSPTGSSPTTSARAWRPTGRAPRPP